MKTNLIIELQQQRLLTLSKISKSCNISLERLNELKKNPALINDEEKEIISKKYNLPLEFFAINETNPINTFKNILIVIFSVLTLILFFIYIVHIYNFGFKNSLEIAFIIFSIIVITIDFILFLLTKKYKLRFVLNITLGMLLSSFIIYIFYKTDFYNLFISYFYNFFN